jgi:hypothetical protein
MPWTFRSDLVVIVNQLECVLWCVKLCFRLEILFYRFFFMMGRRMS